MAKRIFRNVQHEPKIWGVSFFKLFGSLMAGLASIFILDGVGITGLIPAAGGAGVAAALLSLSFWTDHRDPMASDQAPYVRPYITAVEMSRQTVEIIHED